MNAGKGGLVTIGVTNIVNPQKFYDSKTDSRYPDRTVHFAAYNYEQLRKIMKTRAQKAFRSNALEEGVISKIAAKVVQESGDARYAIDTLRVAGEIAINNEVEMVRKTHVDEALERIERDKVLEAVEKLNRGSASCTASFSTRLRLRKPGKSSISIRRSATSRTSRLSPRDGSAN